MLHRIIRLAGIFLLCISFPAIVRAQILDDSTKLVYGPTTTRYVLERDVLENRNRVYTVDTLLRDFHNYNFVNRFQNHYTDLGNIGTPLRSIFYEPPTQIGTYPGIAVYDPYMLQGDDIKYYDTRSPYSSLYYVQGGLQQQLLKVDFSRNITPNWNAGLSYQRITSPELFGTANQSESRQTEHHAFLFHTRYFNKDSTYQLLANFSHLNHRVVDQGGILLNPGLSGNSGDTKDSLFDYDQESAVLIDARSRDFRNYHHLYHQYSLARGFTLYHMFDRNRQDYNFRDGGINTAPADTSTIRFYGGLPFFNNDTTDARIRFLTHENQAGMKGSLGKLDYRLYARRRDVSIGYVPAYIGRRKFSENFLGSWINFTFSDSARIHAEAEYLLFRDYRISAAYENRFWRVGHQRIFRSPTLVQQRIENNHFIWDNDFPPVLTDQTFAYFNVRTKRITVAPFATFSNVVDYIYFDTAAVPQQASRSVQVLSVGLNLELNWKTIYLQGQGVYTRVGGAQSDGKPLIRIPELFGNLRIFYQNYLFKNALLTQIGVETHYKSAYYPDAYMPVAGQYHLQDGFQSNAYVVADLFVNMRIKRVRLFFKIAHINQGLPNLGYFVAPYFVGQPRSFGFGANWLLFD